MASANDSGAPGSDFVLTRLVAAPRALLFKVWTDPDHLTRWFGPAGTSMPTCRMDLRPGGSFHYAMRLPNGQEMWGKWVFVEVVEPERLVLINSFSDANGGLTRHPMSATWPLETMSTTTFVDQGARTELTLRWAPHQATPEERLTFDGAHAGMAHGWAGTMAQLDDYLAKVQAGAAGGAQI
jgi:uncharacterized protein YndB with AHSA1/START domain